MKLVSCLVLITLAVLAACDPPPGLANFNCTPLSPPPAPAQDVRSIHPHDVKVMMAMGDSITAGFGMHEKYIFDGIQEYRGDVYSIGGNGDVASGTYTIPNFFEAVTGSKPLGYSKGQEAPWGAADFNYHNPDVDQLDAAQSGALTPQLDGQVDYLIKQLHATDGVDFDNDWKILTIFIGANNLCELSNPNEKSTSPDAYIADVQAALQKVHDNIPRVFVNLIGLFNISQVWTMDQTNSYCKYLQDLFEECPCLEHSADCRQSMDDNTQQYNARLIQTAADWQAQHLQNFTVVYQPAITDLTVYSLSDLSGFDCFHPSYIADAGFAWAIWNNMWSPPGQKTTNVILNSPFVCPSEDSVLQ